MWPFTQRRAARADLMKRVEETATEAKRANKRALAILDESAACALDRLMPAPKKEKPDGSDHR